MYYITNLMLQQIPLPEAKTYRDAVKAMCQRYDHKSIKKYNVQLMSDDMDEIMLITLNDYYKAYKEGTTEVLLQMAKIVNKLEDDGYKVIAGLYVYEMEKVK